MHNIENSLAYCSLVVYVVCTSTLSHAHAVIATGTRVYSELTYLCCECNTIWVFCTQCVGWLKSEFTQKRSSFGASFPSHVASQKRTRTFYFVSGLATALGLVGCGKVLSRYYYPNPDQVFSLVLPMLRANRYTRV